MCNVCYRVNKKEKENCVGFWLLIFTLEICVFKVMWPECVLLSMITDNWNKQTNLNYTAIVITYMSVTRTLLQKPVSDYRQSTWNNFGRQRHGFQMCLGQFNHIRTLFTNIHFSMQKGVWRSQNSWLFLIHYELSEDQIFFWFL